MRNEYTDDSLLNDPMGYGDARHESSDLRDFAEMYIHIEAYKKFIRKNTLFIFGKRGVGKTAMVEILQHEIAQNINKMQDTYSLSGIINIQNVLSKQCDELNANYDKKDMHTKKVKSFDLWKNLFEKKVMEILSDSPEIDKELKKDIKSYFGEKKRKISKTSKRILNLLTKARNDSVADISTVIETTLEQLGPHHDELYKKCIDFIQEKKIKILIMMDTLDKYDLSWCDMDIIIDCLIDTVKDLSIQKNNISIKVFFPSELYKELHILNTGKIASNVLHITWTAKEITRFIALRLNRYCNYVNNNESFVKYASDKIKTFDYQTLRQKSAAEIKEFICSILPAKSRTLLNDEYDTIPYLEMHTYLRPRQIILLLNNILINYQHDHLGSIFPGKEYFSTYLHQGLKDLTDDYLSAYDNLIHVNFGLLSTTIRTIFQSEKEPTKIYYTKSQLNNLLKHVEPNSHQERKAVLSTLLNIGFLGGCKENELQERVLSAFTGEKKSVTRVSINFIYHLEDNSKLIGLDFSDYYFIHPMFYQYLKCKNEDHLFVIPSHVLEMGLLKKNCLNCRLEGECCRNSNPCRDCPVA